MSILNNHYKILWLCLIVILSSLSGCSALNTAAGTVVRGDTDLKITFKVDADINPDDNKKPSPLFVRMYELKSTKMFDKADFIDLFERDEEILGADLLAKQELKRLKPGEDRKEHFRSLNKETLFVGLYAEFLQYKGSQYKLVIPVTRRNLIANSVTVQVSGNNIRKLD